MLYLRRVMEECTTVEEAEALIRSVPRTTLHNLAVCDRQQAVVLEITPNSVERRNAEQGLCLCTNHFRTKPLAIETVCRRFTLLESAGKAATMNLADIGGHLHAVNQGQNTLQSMIFEPGTLKLHLAVGAGPATARPRTTIDLEPLFQRGAAALK
jgi:isopenicillin-N N-acyltransferase like protein